ncbi:hypothetical protein [Viridibacterium curvum]|uniref:Uncharacterized protein n=1 Tax=Viridibacterium curvum TaxID=1101404 RepID=A0ABP9R5G4_9RHOO
MQKFTGRLALVFALSFGASTAQADHYDLRNIFPQEEIVYRDASGMAAAVLVIRLKPYGSAGISTPLCDAVLDFGDGTPPHKLRLGADGKVLIELPHAYTRAGIYTFSVRGGETRTPCAGRASGQVDVREASDRPPAGTPGKPNAQAAAAAPPNVTLEMRSTSTAEVCPEGWQLVPGSMANGRFSCQRKPLQPFVCPNGTQYFDSGSLVGCR